MDVSQSREPMLVCTASFWGSFRKGNFFFFDGTAWPVGSWFSNRGLNPCPLQWESGVLTTAPPGESQGKALIQGCRWCVGRPPHCCFGPSRR